VSPEDHRSPVEREVRRSFEDEALDGAGRPLSRRARQSKRTVEEYIRAGVAPAYMRRLRQIERELERHKRRLDKAHRLLSAEVGDRLEEFERRWTEQAHTWNFRDTNELIRQHNEWYPIERNLPVDPRTRDYVKIRGRSYQRPELGPDWVLEHFPPVPRAGADAADDAV
jgi:hypothetical protein